MTQQKQTSEPPTYFPVQWDTPEDEQVCWIQANANFPDPITPLDFTILARAVEKGVNQGSDFYKSPDKQLFKHINSFVYCKIISPPDSPDVRTQREQSVHRIEASTKNLNSLWSTSWLPEIQEHIAYWDGYDLKAASLEALTEHLWETERCLHRVWKIHFILLHPVILALHLFEEMHEDLWPEASPLKAHELLLGLVNKTVESNRCLSTLGEQARSDNSINQALMEDDPKEVFKQLNASTEGRKFRSELEDYLNKFGQRSNSQTLSIPSWLEDPRPVIQSLRASLIPKEIKSDPIEALTAKREQRLTEVREDLSGHPPLVVQKFEELLKNAQTAQVLTEDHNYWIEIQVTYRVRQVCLEFGHRFVEKGLLNKVEDIFYLTLDELKDPSHGSTFKEVVKTRMASMQEFKGQTPPLLLGTPDTMRAQDDALSKAYAKMVNPSGNTPVDTDEFFEDSDILKGYGVSSGIAVGPVKVFTNQEEAGNKLKAGDVLVTEMITSFWVPLFPRIAGLITIKGGILSHGSVVAREHGVPAVCGVEKATERLLDGQLIEVNGDTGTIRLLHEKT